KAVVIVGNQRVFSGGFDLAVFQSGEAKDALGMLAGGFELSIGCLTVPAPVIMAATGPAIAMGSFLLLSGDHRVGQPKSRCQAIEVAIGMTIPISAVEIMRARLTPAAFHRGASMAATFAGDEALAGGWLDEIGGGGRGCGGGAGGGGAGGGGGGGGGGGRGGVDVARGRAPGDQTQGARVRTQGDPGRDRWARNGIHTRLATSALHQPSEVADRRFSP